MARLGTRTDCRPVLQLLAALHNGTSSAHKRLRQKEKSFVHKSHRYPIVVMLPRRFTAPGVQEQVKSVGDVTSQLRMHVKARASLPGQCCGHQSRDGAGRIP